MKYAKILLILATTACGFPRPANVGVISGQVHGLWHGTDGVALRLEADGLDTLLTVSADGTFSFAAQLLQGVSYTVTVATNPVRHTCVVDAGGNGMIADADVTNVSVICTGPTVAVALSGLWGWTFDPLQEAQTFSGSIVAQEVALTITGDSLTGASVSGVATALGKETTPIALPLGSTTLAVELTATGGLSKVYQLEFDRGGSALEQVAYGKASRAGANKQFGYSIALSKDTLAVGAAGEASSTTGINGNQADNSATFAGAVYVFVRIGATWEQQAYIKASNTEANDYFGSKVALSGNTLVVSATGEDSSAIGINGNQANNGADASGAAYVFVRNGTSWAQQAYVKASNPQAGAGFGISLALSGDTLAIGAPGESSNATGINGDQANSGAGSSGAVYVYARSGTTWTQQAYVKASNTDQSDQFGVSIALSGDTLAVGAHQESSSATGINQNQSDNNAYSSGAVYVFDRVGITWTQQAYLKASNTGINDHFGDSVALSDNTLAVGAFAEASRATGVNGDQLDDSASGSGAVYVFVRDGAAWVQQAYLKASNTETGDRFGDEVALSGDTVAVGARGEDSNATGVNGGQTDNSANSAGAAYIFVRKGTAWTQREYVKASNTGLLHQFGFEIALSRDTVALGAIGESSNAIGVNGNQADNSTSSAGAVYIYR